MGTATETAADRDALSRYPDEVLADELSKRGWDVFKWDVPELGDWGDVQLLEWDVGISW